MLYKMKNVSPQKLQAFVNEIRKLCIIEDTHALFLDIEKKCYEIIDMYAIQKKHPEVTDLIYGDYRHFVISLYRDYKNPPSYRIKHPYESYDTKSFLLDIKEIKRRNVSLYDVIQRNILYKAEISRITDSPYAYVAHNTLTGYITPDNDLLFYVDGYSIDRLMYNIVHSEYFRKLRDIYQISTTVDGFDENKALHIAINTEKDCDLTKMPDLKNVTPSFDEVQLPNHAAEIDSRLNEICFNMICADEFQDGIHAPENKKIALYTKIFCDEYPHKEGRFYDLMTKYHLMIRPYIKDVDIHAVIQKPLKDYLF